MEFLSEVVNFFDNLNYRLLFFILVGVIIGVLDQRAKYRR